MLTGLFDTHDKTVSLEMGADDYVSKSFDRHELFSRMRSAFRRIRPTIVDQDITAESQSEEMSIDARVLNAAPQSLKMTNGEIITLSGVEFLLLMAFIEDPNCIFSRDQLLNLTGNQDWDPFDRGIDVRITWLRKKIEDRPAEPAFIRTVRASSYLIAPKGLN